jgi:hypothetical protein
MRFCYTDAAMIPVREYIRENKLAANDGGLEKIKAIVSGCMNRY